MILRRYRTITVREHDGNIKTSYYKGGREFDLGDIYPFRELREIHQKAMIGPSSNILTRRIETTILAQEGY